MALLDMGGTAAVKFDAAAGPECVRNLEIWREAIVLAKEAYGLSGGWPKAEAYGLTSQVRRAAVSVATNLAEGIGRGSPAEAARFAQMAVGSLYELDTLIELAGQLGFQDALQGAAARRRITELSRRISTFIRYQRTRRKSSAQATSYKPQATS